MTKKWLSQQEMKDSLIKDGFLRTNEKGSAQDDLIISSLYEIIEDTRVAKNSKDFFDATCRLSSLFEKLDSTSLKSIFDTTNLYVLLLTAVFYNPNFQRELILVTETESAVFGKEADDLNFESKVFLNSAVSLAFFSIAAGIFVLRESNISFLRKVLTDSIKVILRNSAGKKTFANLCFKLEQIAWNHRYHFTDKFPISLDDKKLFDVLNITRSLSGISFLSLTINPVLADQFSKIAEMTEFEEFSMSKALSAVYGVIHRIEESEKSYYENLTKDIEQLLRVFFNTFTRNNERNLLFFLKKISADFHFQKDKKFYEIVLQKIAVAESLRQELMIFSKENLSAFQGDMGEVRYEWSNKVLIASLRLLSVLSGINTATDEKWKVSTAVHEFYQWIDDVHNILNKHSIEDDWILVSDYVNQETAQIEWKSSFFSLSRQVFVSKEADLGLGKKIFEKIVKTILGMLNTDGGVLLIGLVENPDEIVREEFLKKTIHKNGKVFFDVGGELKMLGKTLDSVRLQMFDELRNTTDNSPEKFNDLVTLEPILLKDGESVATIIKIIVNKSEKRFYGVKKEGSNAVWISLTMRAQGQTIDVDVRDYLNL